MHVWIFQNRLGATYANMVVNPSDHFCHGLQIIFYKQLKRYLADIKANGLKFARQTWEGIGNIQIGRIGHPAIFADCDCCLPRTDGRLHIQENQNQNLLWLRRLLNIVVLFVCWMELLSWGDPDLSLGSQCWKSGNRWLASLGLKPTSGEALWSLTTTAWTPSLLAQPCSASTTQDKA